ncbi:MAG: PilZ domain-containing protein, partial [Acidobacteriota bacterium]
MSEERRGSVRYSVYFAGELEAAEGKSSIAITRDVSEHGLLLLSRRELAIGDAVSLQVIWDGEQTTLRGKVVRIEPLAPGESDLWRTK